jgi:hypothetical protein
MEGTVVFFVVCSEATMAGHTTMSRQCFLRGLSPGYITRAVQKAVNPGLVPLRFEEGRPKAVRDKVAGKGQQQY